VAEDFFFDEAVFFLVEVDFLAVEELGDLEVEALDDLVVCAACAITGATEPRPNTAAIVTAAIFFNIKLPWF